MKNNRNFNVLVLAGGKGTRLWPLSREHKPKQFQKLLGEKTMLQETIDRVLPFVSFNNIYVSTNKQYAREVKKELPGLPQKNIILEPAFRERVAAFLLFFCHLDKNQMKQPVVILPSDHSIKNRSEFSKVIIEGANFVKKNPEYILLFGEKPTFPDAGLGYIKKGKKLTKTNSFGVYKVSYFKEKPNLKRAREFLKSGSYFWNVGIFVFLPELILELTRKFIPDNYKRYLAIKKAFGKKNFKNVLEREYLAMDKASFDYSIVENYNKNVFIPVHFGWSDLGSWTVLKNCLSSPDRSYIKGNYIGINSKNILVYGVSDKLVASIGVKDLVIVVADEIILVCHRDNTQKVKNLIERLKKEKRFDYL